MLLGPFLSPEDALAFAADRIVEHRSDARRNGLYLPENGLVFSIAKLY
jgi:hypothetical protein